MKSKKEREESNEMLSFIRFFSLVFGLAVGVGFRLSYGLTWGIVAFFGAIICFWLSVVVGDWLTLGYGSLHLRQEIIWWSKTLQKIRRR